MSASDCSGSPSATGAWTTTTCSCTPPVAECVAPGVAVEVDTWRPVEVADVDGWRLGYSGGFTSRATSVVPLAEPPDRDAAVGGAEGGRLRERDDAVRPAGEPTGVA